MSDATRGLPIASGRTTLAAGWRLLRRRPWRLAGVILILLVGALSGLIAPWSLGQLVDLVSADTVTGAAVWCLGGQILLAALVSAAATGIGIIVAARLFETMLAELREEFIAQAFALPQRTVERAGTGDLVSRASNDVAEISDALPFLLPAATSSIFSVLATAVGMAALDWRFVVALLVTLPVYVLTARWYLRTAPEIYAAERAAEATRAQHLLGSLRGRDTVQAYGLGPSHAGRIASASWEVVKWTLTARTVQNMLTGRLSFAEYLGLAALLTTGFLLVQEDLVTIGGATFAVLLLMRVFEPVGRLLMILDDAQSAAAALARIVGVTAADPEPRSVAEETGEVRAPVHSSASAPHSALAELRDVDFAYEERQVLHGVGLRIRDGEHVALVGASGAGKTTIAALLAGLHVPTSGRVERPERVLLLAQESHVFAGTLASAIRLAKPEASDAEVGEALARVGASGLVASLPAGIETLVGHGGHTLTAAEAQQLALARLILAEPQLAILDEATAEAGSADSGRLERAATEATRGRAALIIAHRLSQAASCDRILVMDDGRIVERGTHAELLGVAGPYAKLWRAWSEHREGGESSAS